METPRRLPRAALLGHMFKLGAPPRHLDAPLARSAFDLRSVLLGDAHHLGLTAEGALSLRLADGSTRAIHAGDVMLANEES